MKSLALWLVVAGAAWNLAACGSDGGGTTDTGVDATVQDVPGVDTPTPEDPGTQDPGTQDPGTQDPGTQDPGMQDPGAQDPGTQDPGMQDVGPFSHAAAPQLAGPFETGTAVTAACIGCHADEAEDMKATVHWTWEGPTPDMIGHEGEKHGKNDTINNFCIAVPSNEPRCTQCHAGYGWKDKDYDLDDTAAMDCLVCHDQSGIYKKDKKTAGLPVADIDLAAAAQSVGKATRANCGACHFYAGGGDNVKKGDLGSAMLNPSAEADVHMGGNDFQCQDCHKTENHAISGASLHTGINGGRVACTDCHDEAKIHGNDTLNAHAGHIACQTCHIPAFSRQQYTKMYWDWSKAGDKNDDGSQKIVKDEVNGTTIYDSMKGEFVWEKDVKPTLAWWNGKFNRQLIGDTYESVPVDLASPAGDIGDPDARIYPFKVMTGIQGVDPENQRVLIPHLFGKGSGENPYWAAYDWALAFAEGMSYVGVDYSGTFDWAETTMHMVINHEVAPKADARACNDCHNGGIDFSELGYTGDPMMVGGQHATK